MRVPVALLQNPVPQLLVRGAVIHTSHAVDMLPTVVLEEAVMMFLLEVNRGCGRVWNSTVLAALAWVRPWSD